ncbi:MAG: acylphosphatase, partial [Bacteroidota bacterium]|nr:acylphosphatase [Bacteroidota bacterium]
MQKSYHILVTGIVQGVGFRPFIYHLAQETGLTGTVENTNEGVEIFISGEESVLMAFMGMIQRKAPRASRIENIYPEEIPYTGFEDFRILRSSNISPKITGISPDIAVCDECLRDMESQPNRIHYPFVNCTLCGPRFSIIRDIPYDREMTTMQSFPMCAGCRSEYENIHDRRFHAQPVACNECGPHYSLWKGEDRIIEDTDTIVSEIWKMLREGKIIAMKGVGGFHLACNAQDEYAVSRLRSKKNREGKP